MTTTSKSNKQEEDAKSFQACRWGEHPPTKAPILFGRDRDHQAARTRWPRLGAISHANLNVSRVDPEAFRNAYIPGEDVTIYMCGCPALQEIARAYKLPLFKVGVTQLASLLPRQRDLNSDQYGSGCYRDGELIYEEGWDRWEMRRSELLFDPSPDSPVCLVPRGLRVRLPFGMRLTTFEKALHAKATSCALHTFARSAIGQQHFSLLGVDPRSVPRLTPYHFGVGGPEAIRVSPAHEIYLVRPREDWTRLLHMAEQIVEAWVLQ